MRQALPPAKASRKMSGSARTSCQLWSSWHPTSQSRLCAMWRISYKTWWWELLACLCSVWRLSSWTTLYVVSLSLQTSVLQAGPTCECRNWTLRSCFGSFCFYLLHKESPSFRRDAFCKKLFCSWCEEVRLVKLNGCGEQQGARLVPASCKTKLSVKPCHCRQLPLQRCQQLCRVSGKDSLLRLPPQILQTVSWHTTPLPLFFFFFFFLDVLMVTWWPS